MAGIDLSIIIPAYKEGPVLGENLRELAAFLKTRDYGAVEIVVMMQSDDTSGDIESARASSNLFNHFRLINLGKRAGKGGAVRAGMFAAHGRYRLFMDADLATPIVHLDDVYRLMQQNAEAGIAVRDLFKIHKGILRKLMSKASNIAAQILLLPGIKDSQCGFKVFRADVAEAVFGRQTMLSWSFDMEVLALCKYLGYQVQTFEAPDWKDPKPVGLVGDSMFKVILTGFMDPFKIRWRLLTGGYKQKTYEPKPTH